MTKQTWGISGGDHITPDVVAVSSLGGGILYEVWRAFDERLYAPVVVKILRPDVAADERRRRELAREAEFLDRLRHPSIVRLFDVDPEGERPHLVIENIDGPSLSSLIGKHGGLPIQQLVPLAIELGSAAHFLRRQGICHLDIKPSNVIMGAPAKLIDLSIALSAEAAAATTHPVGSDQYMAPEQCRPHELGTMGPASDMWGIGATLFRAAVGRRAFTTGDPDADDPAVKWPQLVEDHRPVPEKVPAAFAELVLACLDRDPAHRPLPAEFVDAMEPIMARMPTAKLSGFSIKL